MDDLTLFSWNLEKKSLGGLTSNADNVRRIVSSVVDVVGQGVPDADAPFVGFLLEIKGQGVSVDRMCRLIKSEYRRKTGHEISVESRFTGGASSTAESIIVMSRGATVTQARFDIQEGIRTFATRDRARADDLCEAHKVRNSRLRPRDDSNPYAPKPENYRKIRREPEWFRNGVLADVTHQGETIRVASLHAPGPDLSDKVEEVVDTILQSAADGRVDVMIGDLNRRGTLPADYFEDISEGWATGTTLGRTNPDQLGTARWDRVLASRTRTFEIESPDPIAVLRSAEIGPRLSDHALVYARIRRRVVPELTFGAIEPVSLATAPPVEGGVDLRALDSAGPPTVAGDATMAYAALTNRSDPGEAPRDPFASTAAPPTDPLGPPPLASPLSAPPEDVAMHDAMKASVAAEGATGSG